MERSLYKYRMAIGRLWDQKADPFLKDESLPLLKNIEV
jgi:hypothetical protein